MRDIDSRILIERNGISSTWKRGRSSQEGGGRATEVTERTALELIGKAGEGQIVCDQRNFDKF